jgi:hypothetical protein
MVQKGKSIPFISHDDHFNIIAQNKINQMIMCYYFKGMQFGNIAIHCPHLFSPKTGLKKMKMQF